MPRSEVIRFENIVTGSVDQEEYWFVLDEDELAHLFPHAGASYGDLLRHLIHTDDENELVENIKKLLHASVARRTGDELFKGRGVLEGFVESGAYRKLFLDLLMDERFAESFFNDVFPLDIYPVESSPREYTDEELLTMPEEEFRAIAGEDETEWSRHHLLIGMRRRITKAA